METTTESSKSPTPHVLEEKKKGETYCMLGALFHVPLFLVQRPKVNTCFISKMEACF
jgi:hypothetical protein